MEELVKEISELRALVSRLLLCVEKLDMGNADLHRQLGQNSSNSYKLLLSECYSKKPLIKAALPKSSGKKRNGQHGHADKTLQFLEHSDEIHTHSASYCVHCGLCFTRRGTVGSRRQVFDLLATRLWVRQHELVTHHCSCGSQASR